MFYTIKDIHMLGRSGGMLPWGIFKKFSKIHLFGFVALGLFDNQLKMVLHINKTRKVAVFHILF